MTDSLSYLRSRKRDLLMFLVAGSLPLPWMISAQFGGLGYSPELTATLAGFAILGGAMLLLRKHTTDYWSHVAIGTTFGMAYTAYPRFADIIWSAFPPGYQLMMIFSDGFSWILITMVMAWFVVPRKA